MEEDLALGPAIGARRRRAGGYFAGNAGAQRKYYGIKNSINFARRYPLSQWSYIPLRRGSELSLQQFGPSFRQATDAQKARRRELMMRGRGLYKGRGGFFGGLAGLLSGQGWKAGSDMGDKLWDAGGKTLAGFVPGLSQAVALGDMVAPAGQAIASHYGKGLYKGRGAYATNNLITDGGATVSSVVPQFNPSDLHEIVYSNREYVRDIFAPGTAASPSSVPFLLQQWSLNPGLPDSFPWLSQLAINFEEYEIMQLAYTFKSTIADFASASGQVGQVVMCTQYNPNSDPFADKEEMMLYEGGMSCKTTESLIHGVECDPKKIAGSAQKYVRAGNLPATEDLKNYDLGRTALAIIGCPTTYAGQQLGELWVSYTVRLRKPKFASGNAYNIRRDVFITPPTGTPAGLQNPDCNSNTLIVGARNSLGCTLTCNDLGGSCSNGAGTDDLGQDIPTTMTSIIPKSFTITFPPSYAGIVRIRVISTNSSAAPSNPPAFVSLAPNTIARFKDVPNVFTTSLTRSWRHYRISRADDTFDGFALSSDCEIHLRLQPAQNGIPNVLQYSYNSGVAGATVTHSIEITQYNTFLSVQDNGTNDALALTNTAGVSTVWV